MKKDINIEIGARIKEKRKSLKYTRESLAELIDISPQFLAEIECGKKGMSFTTLSKLCHVLGVSCDYLILGKTAESKNKLYELSDAVPAQYAPIAAELLSCLLRTIATVKKDSSPSVSEGCES